MAPPVEAIHEARKLFNELEYPILFHCKSGADRAGLMGALFMYMKEGKPIEEAVKQLSLKFGHFKQSETGVLDYLFERYMADNDAEPMTFFEWLETRYDPAEIKRTFRTQGLGEPDCQPRTPARVIPAAALRHCEALGATGRNPEGTATARAPGRPRRLCRLDERFGAKLNGAGLFVQ